MRSLLRRLSGAERLLVVVFVATLPLASPLIRGDGVGYYAYVRSLLIDGDLRFENEWLAANASFVRGVTDASGRLRPDVYTPTGYVANHFAVGPAMLWAPPLALTHLGVLLTRRFGAGVAADGYSWPYRWTVALATAGYGFLGLLLAFRATRRLVPERWALVGALGIWFASSLPVYMYFNPAWAHALSAFAVSLFVWYWLRTRDGRTLGQWTVLGLIGGLMVNVYYPNAVLLVIPGLEAVREYLATATAPTRGRLPRVLRGHLLFSAGVLVALLPTFVTRKIIYGTYLASGYPSLRTWCWTRPWLVEVLFSSNHGLLSWTPIVSLALLGLGLLAVTERQVGGALAVGFLAFYYLIAAYPTWHGISSYGNRFFVSLTPLFVVGLAAALVRLGRRRPAVAYAILTVAVLWNLGLIFQWGTNMIPNRGPVAWREVIANQVQVVPRRLLATAIAYAGGRGALLATIQQQDMAEVEAWTPPTPPCR